MGSFDIEREAVDGIVRTDCWWDSVNANGSYGLIRIGTESNASVTSLWNSVHANGSFWLLVGSTTICPCYCVGRFDSGEQALDGIVRTAEMQVVHMALSESVPMISCRSFLNRTWARECLVLAHFAQGRKLSMVS